MRILCSIVLLLCGCVPGPAADARTITEGTNNILAIGIDNRDYDIIRFYLRGTNVVEIRADQLLHRDQALVSAPISPVKSAERDALLAALAAHTNWSGAGAQVAVSNLVRLKVIEAIDDTGRPRPAR